VRGVIVPVNSESEEIQKTCQNHVGTNLRNCRSELPAILSLKIFTKSSMLVI